MPEFYWPQTLKTIDMALLSSSQLRVNAALTTWKSMCYLGLCGRLNGTPKYPHPDPCDCTLTWQEFVDMIKDLEIGRLPWIIRWALNVIHM